MGLIRVGVLPSEHVREANCKGTGGVYLGMFMMIDCAFKNEGVGENEKVVGSKDCHFQGG